VFIPSSRWNKLRPAAKTFLHDEGQSLVEYAMALGIILVLAIGVLRLFETNAYQVLVQIAKSIG
jgi:hypothetical protein